jgi:ADP-heptose:LPS heptosyltransferase
MKTPIFVSRTEMKRQFSLVDLKAGVRAISRTIEPASIHLDSTHTSSQGDNNPDFSIMTEDGIRSGALAYPVPPMPRLWTGRNQLIEPRVNKIAVLRSNGIGDFIFAIPALEALRQSYPQAEIVLLASDWHAAFLKNRPGPVDRVIVIPKSRGVNGPEDGEEDPQELERFFDAMSQEKFDMAIQMHGGGRYSNPFIRKLGAKLTVGACSEDALPLDRCVPYLYYQMEILRYLEIVSLVGAYSSYYEPRIFVTDEDLQTALEHAPESPEPLAVLNPGAGDPRRRWPTSKFAKVGDALASVGARIVVIGAEWDRGIVQEVCNAMSADSQDLSGKLDLSALTGLLSRANLVVSNDSGPLHLAAAVGAPTVGIYWCGNMITAGPLTRSRHRPAISWRLDCPVCGLDCTRTNCGHKESFVADVDESEVIRYALDLLQMSKKKDTNPHSLTYSLEGG